MSDSEEEMAKQCYGSSVRKVVTAAILLLILEVNMIAIYTYNMVDHSDFADTPKKEDIVVRVKRVNMDYLNTDSTLGNLLASVKHSLHMDSGNTDEVSSGDGQFPEEQLINQGHPELYEKKLNKTSKHGKGRLTKPSSATSRHILPSFYIIGGRTSETDTLRKLLGYHPQMVTATSTHYFVEDAAFHKGDNWYQNRLPLVPPGKKLLEVDEDLFSSPNGVYRLKRKNPLAKLILILREPIERMLADFLTAHKNIEGSGEQTYEGYFVSSNGSSVNEQSPIVVPSIYDIHLKNWLSQFKFSQFLFIDFSQLMTQPYTIMKKVEKFLEIKPFFQKKNFVHYDKSLCYRSAKYVCLTPDNPDLVLPTEIEEVIKPFFTQHMDSFWTIVSNDLSVNDLSSLI